MEAALNCPFSLLSLWMLPESFLDDNSFQKGDAVTIKNNTVEIWLYFRHDFLCSPFLLPLKVLLKLKYYTSKV